MASLTFERVLASAETLPAEEQTMLAELLQRRRTESWRKETAADAVVAVKKFRSGKLKPASAENVIARLRAAK